MYKKHVIYLRQGGLCNTPRLCVCLSASNFACKLLIGSSWTFYQRCIFAHGRYD